MSIQTEYLRTIDGLLRDIRNLVDSADLGEAAYSDFANGSGLALREGSHGYGGLTIPGNISDCNDTSRRNGIYNIESGATGSPFSGPGLLVHWRRINSVTITQMASRQYGFGTTDVLFFRVITPNGVGPWGEVLMLGINADTDTNGFYIASSPVVRLYSDTMTDNGQVPDVTVSWEGVGDYAIHGSTGLATDGKGTIFVPKDDNGNVEVHVCHEFVDGVIRIKTSKPDYSTGPCTAGEPMDIPEGRFISIRLHEHPPVDEGVVEENPEDEKEFMGD